VTQGTADLDLIAVKDAPAKSEVGESATAKLIVAMKEALGDKVKNVRSSTRLTDSAVCLVADGELDRTLEKLLARQKDSGVNVSAPVLEINAGHPLIVALAAAADAGASSPEIADAAQLLLDQAYVLEGEPVSDPAGFSRRMANVLTRAFAK
jgi:molecular chaperone HtpG